MESVTLLLSSAGRRPYLVEWFQAALVTNNVDGRVLVVDADPQSPSRQVADTFLVSPPVVSDEYDEWLESTLTDEDVGLAVSLNDFELSRWAQLGTEFTSADRLIRLQPDIQRVVEDKLLMARALREHGIRVPEIQTAAATLELLGGLSDREVVTKGRFGSASRGLRMATLAELPEAVAAARREVTDASGRAVSASDSLGLELLVVQHRVRGDEYGLDVVSDLAGVHATVLARRKIAMRAGETDRALSVDPEPFKELGVQLSQAIPHCGSIDVDVLVDADGNQWVIDVNPRFGGGYPFSHLAGADLPAAYVAWMVGTLPNPSWLVSTPGVVSSKYVGVARST